MTHNTTNVLKKINEVKKVVKLHKQNGESIGFVPTMGFLHSGHLSLIEESTKKNDITFASIFVNPTQFSPGEDLEKYPRNIELDLEKLTKHKTDYVFIPEQNERGYIPFNLPDTIFKYSDDGQIAEIIKSEETESHKIVENCMLVANEYVAKQLNKLLGNAIYRVHENPDDEAVNKIISLLEFYEVQAKGKSYKSQKLIQNLLEAMPTQDYHRVFDFFILRSMKKARYDTESIGHFGLAMRHYTHFTSPIRRVSDLTVHHLLKQYLWKEDYEKKLAENQLKEIADKASEREIIADSAERELSYQFKKLYMKDKIGQEFSGIIVNMTGNNMMIEFDDLPVTGIIANNSLTGDNYRFYQQYMRLIGRKTGRVFKLMDKVRVRLERVDYDLILSLVDDSKKRSGAKAKDNKRKRNR